MAGIMPAPAPAPAPAHHPPSPDLQPSSKRARQSSPDKVSPTSWPSVDATSPTDEQIHDGSSGAAGHIGQSSGFRNVSACNRCRLRKNRCDQKLPSCASCDKAGVACVGYDPITKQKIPRSYVLYLEKRVQQLEELLTSNNLPFPPAQDLDYCSKSTSALGSAPSPTEAAQPPSSEETERPGNPKAGSGGDDSSRLHMAASKPGAAAHRHVGSTSGISFARVVFAAVQSSVSDQKSNSDKGGVRPYRPGPGGSGSGSGTSMRDSFFGLHTKPTVHPATFPNRELGFRLAKTYFEYANPQLPILHKGEFQETFEQAYAEEGQVRGPRQLYMLNMVFAIGAGILVGDSKGDQPPPSESAGASPGARQCQPEEYHASAIAHLEACFGSDGGLQDLQAVLLLANFALLRPVPPGLWYIAGVAVRLAVDLGLHYEDGKDLHAGLRDAATPDRETVAKERGRREYQRDLKRRLWWCTYSLDRLVSLCVGRPFGISDQVITTGFPSLLEDRYITQSGIVGPPPGKLRPTYKLVAHHYFRLRLLQSEILQVLQFRQAQSALAGGQTNRNPYMHYSLPSPFLSKFGSFRSWRIDIDKRLWEWKNSAPKKQDTGVAFSPEFLDLNYWQAIILLYRQSLSVPTVFEGEYDTAKEVNSPRVFNAELREDEDRVYLKVAEAGQKILRLYRQLHLLGVVNYTYLTTHHLFVAGISYLYAIWHSPIVRSRLAMEEVDFTVLAATSVFADFMDKCPPAEACRDAFERTVRATLKMVNASGGFGQKYAGQASEPSASRGSLGRTPRSGRRDDKSGSASAHHHHRRHDHHPASLEASSDAYSSSASSASLLSALQKGARYRAPRAADMPSSTTSTTTTTTNTTNTTNNNAITPEAPPLASIKPPPMPSPTMTMQQSGPATLLGSPTAADTDRSPSGGFLSPQQQFSPGALSLSDLQGMELLQSLSGSGGGGGAAGGGGGAGAMEGIDFSGMPDAQMDLGLGLGWEGLHPGFGEGQQVDLFDGFFFGGPAAQGNGADGLGGDLMRGGLDC